MASILLSFSFLLALILSVQAQQFTPVGIEQFAFARAGPKLYIQGGTRVINDVAISISSELYSLDLSTSWTAGAVPWKVLAPGVQAYFTFGIASPDNQTITVIGNGAGGSIEFLFYNIALNTWNANPTIITPDQDNHQGIRPITDPTTWLTYMNAYANMDIYNPNTTTIVTKAMPANTFTSRMFSGAAYISSRRTIMYFGGLNASILLDPLATYVTEYNIVNNAWSNFTTSGNPPAARSDFCMTASEDGNTVIIYGGRSPTTTSFTGSMYMLDVPTAQWTQLPDGVTRVYMACVVVGDQFLVWGGGDGHNTYNDTPAIFSLTTRQWGTSYTAPDYYLKATSTSASTSGLPSQTGSGPPGSVSSNTTASTNNLGAILGGALGGLLVIALSVIAYMFLKRKRNNIQFDKPPEQDGEHIKKLGAPVPLNVNKSSFSQDRSPHTHLSSIRHPHASDSPWRNPHTQLSDPGTLPDPYVFSSSKDSVMPGMSLSEFRPPQTGNPVVYIHNVPTVASSGQYIQYIPTTNMSSAYSAPMYQPYVSYSDEATQGIYSSGQPNAAAVIATTSGYTPYTPASSDMRSSLYGNNGGFSSPAAMMAPNDRAYIVTASAAHPHPAVTSVNNSNSNFGHSTYSMATGNTVNGATIQGSPITPSIPPRPSQPSVRYTAVGREQS